MIDKYLTIVLQFRAFQGNPSTFMKILHYALFFSSKAVTNYLYTRDIDPNTIHMNDYAFMERIMYITVGSFIIN